MLSNVRPLALSVAAVASLAACSAGDHAAPEAPAGPASGSAGAIAAAPRLPGRIVRTDGHGDIAVALPGQATCAATSTADAAVALTSANALRRAHGLAPLALDARLQQAAQAHACDMALRGLMTHVGTSTSGPRARASRQGYRARIAAENIAAGRLDLQHVLAEWAGSPKHAANMLFPQLRQTGIGHAVAADGKTMFWTAIYAAPHQARPEAVRMAPQPAR